MSPIMEEPTAGFVEPHPAKCLNPKVSTMHGLIYLPNDRTQSFYLMGHFKTQAKVESQSSLSNFIILATNYKLNLILEIISNKIL